MVSMYIIPKDWSVELKNNTLDEPVDIDTFLSTEVGKYSGKELFIEWNKRLNELFK